MPSAQALAGQGASTGPGVGHCLDGQESDQGPPDEGALGELRTLVKMIHRTSSHRPGLVTFSAAVPGGSSFLWHRVTVTRHLNVILYIMFFVF